MRYIFFIFSVLSATNAYAIFPGAPDWTTSVCSRIVQQDAAIVQAPKIGYRTFNGHQEIVLSMRVKGFGETLFAGLDGSEQEARDTSGPRWDADIPATGPQSVWWEGDSRTSTFLVKIPILGDAGPDSVWSVIFEDDYDRKTHLKFRLCR